MKKVDIPPNPLLEQGFQGLYTYHDQFVEIICKMLAKPVRAELQRRNMSIKLLCEELSALGFKYSYEAMRQAFIGRNISMNNFGYWVKIYYYLGIPVDEAFSCKLDES